MSIINASWKMTNIKPFYKFYNRNDKGLLIEDCVCRAISTATGLNYQGVENLLALTAKKHKCQKLCVCCYHYLLEDLLAYKVYYCDYTKTVKQVARQYYNNKLIIRTDGHLTCSLFGTVTDTWDCSKELVDCFWIVD